MKASEINKLVAACAILEYSAKKLLLILQEMADELGEDYIDERLKKNGSVPGFDDEEALKVLKEYNGMLRDEKGRLQPRLIAAKFAEDFFDTFFDLEEKSKRAYYLFTKDEEGVVALAHTNPLAQVTFASAIAASDKALDRLFCQAIKKLAK